MADQLINAAAQALYSALESSPVTPERVALGNDGQALAAQQHGSVGGFGLEAHVDSLRELDMTRSLQPAACRKDTKQERGSFEAWIKPKLRNGGNLNRSVSGIYMDNRVAQKWAAWQARAALAAQAPQPAACVWAVENKVSLTLFANKADAEAFVGSFPMSVSGGLQVSAMPVLGAPQQAQGVAAEWLPKIIYGPSHYVCWTPDRTPIDQRVNLVLISEADYQQACQLLAAARAALAVQAPQP